MPPAELSPDELADAARRGERNGLASRRGAAEQHLDSQDPGMETAGATGAGGERNRRCLNQLRVSKRWCLRVVAFVAFGVLALMVFVLAASVGRCERSPAAEAPVVACSLEWVVHRNVCFYLSGPQEEGGWDWSQERCSARGASLVMITRDWEMEFLMRLKGNVDYWLGLRRQGERLVWVDGSTFEETFKVQGLGECVYLNEDDVASSSCSQSRPYICSKPQALVAPPESGAAERTFPARGPRSSSA